MLLRTKQFVRSAQVRVRQALGQGMLPNVIVPGVQKGGTTSMYFYLAQHPNVAASLRQEVHYFDVNYRRGLNWYRAQFRAGPDTICAVDVTPYYLFHPLVPKRITETIPAAKFVVLLRNPIDRAVSHYWNSVRFRHEKLPLDEAIVREEERLRGSDERLRSGQGEQDFAHRHFSYLSRGLYARQLHPWFSTFDRNDFLILESEQLFRNTADTMREVFGFVGLPPCSISNTQAFNRNKHEKIDPGLRKRLAGFYAGPNRELEVLLGRKFSW